MKHDLFQLKNANTELAACVAWFLLLITPLQLLIRLAGINRVVFFALLFFSGWLCWTFVEYCLHRFKDHGEQDKKAEGQEKLHHYHHKHPTEIAISPLHRAGLFVLCAILISLAVWFDNYFVILPGFVVGFTSYTFTHWLLHHKISARLFPELHRFHIHHHCKHPDKCFGITITWWDHLFGTIPTKNTEITERVLSFYYKKEKKKNKKNISLNNIIDEKIRVTNDQLL